MLAVAHFTLSSLHATFCLGYTYALLNPNNQHYTYVPGFIDIRDVARAHILALSSQYKYPQQRMLLKAPGPTSYKKAIEISEAKFGKEVQGRLASKEKAPGEEWAIQEDKALEWSVKTKDGTWPEGWKSWKECVEDTVDSLLDMEKFRERERFGS
ncbi:hypothetical protein K435DRAFT_875448 [Dendrothele bispora CBS 962.96]|uniref:NAD(P)-binding protein n=1 Tax=Dendrothele bispora (strain CBS 962.96) TaxID=1314807 RepID=A0A4S8KU90_DENBC|nr:hypothetical protein K435DRAFT_875448 [Dendrothele bispora CBS 962.96]